jgi:hypothetical protein
MIFGDSSNKAMFLNTIIMIVEPLNIPLFIGSELGIIIYIYDLMTLGEYDGPHSSDINQLV